jgi:DNA excision repair protein ERCC-2
MEAAREASVIIGDYNHMFTRGPNLLQRLGRREGEAILIVDEGHNLPRRIMEEGSGRTTAASLRHARSSPELRHFAEDMDIIISSFERLAHRPPERILGEHLDGPLERACGVDAGRLAEELEAATQGGREYRGLIEFLRAWSAPDEATVRYLEGDPSRLVVGLIDPSLLASPVLSRVRCSLVMSGPLHPPEMFADVLGMRGAVCRTYPSPFPEENRVVLAGGRISSRYRSRGTATYEMTAQEIAHCADSAPGNVAVFFPSYEFMGRVERLLASLVGDRKVLVERREHGKREREVVLGRLREGRNLLLGTIGGSYSEGIDFRDNVLSMVIVVGLPLSPPSREMEAMRELLEGRFGRRRAHLYTQLYPAVARVLQASGRAIRSKTDRAAIVLLDDRYTIPQVRAAFPRDFGLEVPGDIVERARKFYSSREGVKGVDPNIADRKEPT